MKYIVILAAVLFVALYYIIAEITWQLRNRTFRHRIIIGVLVTALLVSQTSIVNLFTRTDAESAAAAEAENTEIITISGFAELPDDIREQTVPVGTSLEELELPDTLEAVCGVADDDVDADAGADTDPDEDTDADTDEGTDADPEAGEGADTDTDAGTGTDTDADAGTGTDTDADAGTDTDTDADQDTDTDIDIDTDTGVDADTDIDTDTDIDAGNDTDTNADTYTDTDVTMDNNTLGDIADTEGDTEKVETFSVTMPEYQTEHIIELKTLEADSLSEAPDEHSEDSKEAERSEISETSQETIIIENITWQSEPEYDGDTEGEYIFTAILPEGYALTNEVNTPQITVTVGGTDDIALMSNDGIMLMASNEPPLSGGGTVDNPYKISSEADLKTLATFVNAGTNAGAGTDNSCSGMYFELTKDITLSGTWTPIGKEVGVNNNSFSGIFDGKNHTISGLNITVSQGQQGLFGVVKEGEIKNLNVKGTITGTNKNYYSVGGVVGYNDLGIIENCSFSGTISVIGDKAGGIAGYNSGNAKGTMGIIRNCTASGAVTGTQYVGGILGHNVTGTVQNCYNNCTVEGTYAVGGIVGYNAQTSIVSNSYNTGNVECNGDKSGGSRVGGIAGMNSDSTINNCYNEGTVTGNLDYVGGVAGYNTATVQNCYNRGTVTGSGDKVGGVIGDGSGTVTNSYYLNTCQAAGTGESKTSAQFTSGEVTWLLQNGQSDFVWGQTLNSNNYPLLVTFTSSAKRVWKVKFMDGSTERAVKYVNDGNNITEPTDVTRDGYTAEWYTAQNGGGSKYNFSSAVKADLTLYVKWVENKCTVTFDANGGSASSTTQEYKIGETYGTLPTANRTGYTFDGWYTTATGGTKITATSIVSKDVTRLYAHWTADKYDITYKDQGSAAFSGTHESGYPTKHTYGTATTLKSASKTGYTFGGWYTDSSCMTKVTSLGASAYTSNITLYAKWTANQYTVSFNSAGGSSVSDKTVTYDSPYGELPTTTRTGYTFKGWYSGANGNGTEVKSTTKVATDSNHTLYAYWTGNPYEVTLKYQDGKTADKKITVTYGSTYGSDLSTEPSRPGYRFLGWFTQEEGGNEVNSNTEVTTAQNHMLFAQWKDDIAPDIGELTYNYSTKNVAGYVIGNKNLTITVPVTEEGSGADEIEYTSTAVKGTSKSGTAAIETNGAAKFTVDADFEGSIEITCTDKEGNKSSKTVKVILEGNDPTVSFKIAGIAVSGETDYYDVAPAVDVNVTDDMNNAISGGIASVTYQVDNGAAKTVDGAFATGIVPHYSFAILASEIPSGVNDITVKVEDNAGNTAEAILTVKVKGPEKTPEAKLDEVHVTITDLVPGAEYDITYTDTSGQTHTDTVTADESGNLDIKDDWTGGDIEIVKKGNGTDTTDSEPQELGIPEREPEISGPLTVTDESLKGANDGKIGGLNPEEEYEVSKDGGKTWEKKKANKDGEIEPLAPGGYEVRRPGVGGTLPSKSVPVDVKESNFTQEETPEAKLDEVHVTITGLVPGAEYDITYKDADGNPHTDKVKADENGNLDIKDDWTGSEIEIVKKGNGTDTVDSEPQKGLYIPEREPAPENLTKTDESLKGANDGKIGGLNPGEEYEVSTDGGKTWEKKKANADGEIEPLAPGSYKVRRPGVDGTLPSKPTPVNIKESNITQEATPEASVDRQDGKIKGLVPGAKYDITYTDEDGNKPKVTRTADENGNLEIEDDWTSGNIDIVKKGSGDNNIDSLPQSLAIPEREPAPTDAKMSKKAGKNGKGGSIGGLTPGETYQISRDGGETWEDVTADEEGEIKPIEAGSYDIRKKAGDNTLPSNPVHVQVTKQKDSGSGGSTGGGEGNGNDDSDNGGGQPDDDGGNGQTDNTPGDSVTPPADEKTPETNNPPADTPKKQTPKKETPKKEEPKQDTGKTQEESGKPEQSTTPESEPSADTADQTAPTETEDDAVEITGDSVATGTIRDAQNTTTTLTVGEGSVSVTVVSDEYRYAAGVKDTVAVVNAVLTPEQKQHVNDGGKIEIRVEVTDISAQVSQQDKDIIESGLADHKITGDTDEQGELTLGAYIDISMYIRVGDGDWDAITQAGEPIEVVIGIPDDLLSEGRTFYIARSHEGDFALLDDLDTEADTITIRTELFSTYAIVYRQGFGTDTDGANGFLASLSWTAVALWSLGILVMLGIAIFLIFWKRRKEEEAS